MDDYLTSKWDTRWDEDEDSPSRAERLPEGVHKVKIAKVVSQRSDGTPITTSKGDRCLLVVYESEDGKEAIEIHTLSPKGEWTLRRMIKRFGVDRKLIEARIKKVGDFLDEETSNEVLCGHMGYIRVGPGRDGRLKAEPMRPEDGERILKAQEVFKVKEGEDDDIPF